MPGYIAVLSKKAQKQPDKLSDNIAAPIFKAITKLEEDPIPQGYKKLKGQMIYKQNC